MFGADATGAPKTITGQLRKRRVGQVELRRETRRDIVALLNLVC